MPAVGIAPAAAPHRRVRELALAALVARVLRPASKFATARQLSPGTAASSLDVGAIGAHEAMQACKSLSRVERAFRNLKSARLEVRPMYVYSAGRVRAHVFLCALACHVEWRLRR